MRRLILTGLAIGMGVAGTPALAQSHRELDRAVDAAILSDVSKDRQAERDAKRQPYASPGYGTITSAHAARDACAAKARYQAGPGAVILGKPDAQTMATGWEVEGEVGFRNDSGSIPFVCSVRNGSVSGILLKR
jgi:hypothetical protein